MYIKTLTQVDLIESDFGPSYQYCEACFENMFAGDKVVRTTEEVDGLDALYCIACKPGEETP